MKKIADLVKENMDILQAMMESGKHLSEANAVTEQFGKCRLYLAHMDEEDLDYLACARVAIEEQLPWDIPAKEVDNGQGKGKPKI